MASSPPLLSATLLLRMCCFFHLFTLRRLHRRHEFYAWVAPFRVGYWWAYCHRAFIALPPVMLASLAIEHDIRAFFFFFFCYAKISMFAASRERCSSPSAFEERARRLFRCHAYVAAIFLLMICDMLVVSRRYYATCWLFHAIIMLLMSTEVIFFVAW